MKYDWLTKQLQKHKKKTLGSAIIVCIVYAFEYGGNYVTDKIETLYSLEKVVKKNELRIEALEYKAAYYDDLIKMIVTRTSFDNYILRKDKEYEDQAAYNLAMTGQINKVDGRVDELAIVINALNDFNICQTTNRCKNVQPNF